MNKSHLENSFLGKRPILAMYTPKALTERHTDISKLGLSDILMQRGEESSREWRPILLQQSKFTTVTSWKFLW